MANKVRVTVELLDHEDSEPIVWVLENTTLEQRRAINKVCDEESGFLARLQPSKTTYVLIFGEHVLTE